MSKGVNEWQFVFGFATIVVPLIIDRPNATQLEIE